MRALPNKASFLRLSKVYLTAFSGFPGRTNTLGRLIVEAEEE